MWSSRAARPFVSRVVLEAAFTVLPGARTRGRRTSNRVTMTVL